MVIYNIPTNNKDFSDITTILNSVSCTVDITNLTRTDRSKQAGSAQPRPLRLFCRSKCDCELILYIREAKGLCLLYITQRALAHTGRNCE